MLHQTRVGTLAARALPPQWGGRAVYFVSPGVGGYAGVAVVIFPFSRASAKRETTKYTARPPTTPSGFQQGIAGKPG